MGMETGQVSAQVWTRRIVPFTGAEGIMSGQDGGWAQRGCATPLPVLQWKYRGTKLWGASNGQAGISSDQSSLC